MDERYTWDAWGKDDNGNEIAHDHNGDNFRDHSCTEASLNDIFDFVQILANERNKYTVARDYDGRAYICPKGSDDHVYMVECERWCDKCDMPEGACGHDDDTE